jgi:hypothetical protein
VCRFCCINSGVGQGDNDCPPVQSAELFDVVVFPGLRFCPPTCTLSYLYFQRTDRPWKAFTSINTNAPYLFIVLFSFSFLFLLAVLGFDHRASHLLGRSSTSPVLFAFVILRIGSLSLFFSSAWTARNPPCMPPSLLHGLDHRLVPPPPSLHFAEAVLTSNFDPPDLTSQVAGITDVSHPLLPPSSTPGLFFCLVWFGFFFETESHCL